MGARNSKLRLFYRDVLRTRKAALKCHRLSPDEATAQLIEMGAEEEPLLDCTDYLNCHELGEMQQQIDTLAVTLRERLDGLETTHRQRLQQCAIRWQNAEKCHAFGGLSAKKRRKLESMTDECRLRSSLLAEKIKNCLDYLQNFDTMICSIQREQQKRKSGPEDDDFLREFLLKSARHQHRKGQIGQSVDTFCQLLLATGGHLRTEEMEVLADICREKIRHIREFHERISQTVQQLNKANTVRDNVVVQELWGQVLEDLRTECAESFEIVMQVKTGQSGRETAADQQIMNCRPQKNNEQLKLLMASTVCALWLHITPREHEEFDDIKDLFFSTLDDYIETFRIVNGKSAVKSCRDAYFELEKTVRELMGNYPTVASTKKMRKIAQRILII